MVFEKLDSIGHGLGLEDQQIIILHTRFFKVILYKLCILFMHLIPK